MTICAYDLPTHTWVHWKGTKYELLRPSGMTEWVLLLGPDGQKAWVQAWTPLVKV